MRLSIGDLVHNDATQERGHIVRFFSPGQPIACVVATTNKISGQVIEALWFASDIREFKQRARIDRTKTTDHQHETSLDANSAPGV